MQPFPLSSIAGGFQIIDLLIWRIIAVLFVCFIDHQINQLIVHFDWSLHAHFASHSSQELCIAFFVLLAMKYKYIYVFAVSNI